MVLAEVGCWERRVGWLDLLFSYAAEVSAQLRNPGGARHGFPAALQPPAAVVRGVGCFLLAWEVAEGGVGKECPLLAASFISLPASSQCPL